MALTTIFERPNALVTGGAGFVGSHICDALIKTHKVICVDNFISGDEKNIDHLLQDPNFEFIRHDITEPLNLEALVELDRFKIKFQGIQEIYHFACPTSSKHFDATMIQTALANSRGVQLILDLAVQYRAKFLLASSAVVYGSRDPLVERCSEAYQGIVDPINPRACYNEGKRFAETLASTYRQVHGLDIKIARLFRAYGSRMKLSDGQMVPDFVSAALEGKPLVIYGDKATTSSFCHISDLVQGIIKLMNSTEAGPINLGSDQEYALFDLAHEVCEITQSASEIIFEPALPYIVTPPIPDISLARERLSWFPVMPLKTGLTQAIDYFKAHKSIIAPGTITAMGNE